jgi:hypothetical protein
MVNTVACMMYIVYIVKLPQVTAPASLESQEYVTLEVAKERDRQFFSQCATSTEKTQVELFSQCATSTEKHRYSFSQSAPHPEKRTSPGTDLFTVRHIHRE